MILPYIFKLNWYILILFQIINKYDQTFDPKVLIGHCDLISRFSQLVCEHTYFTIFNMLMTRSVTLKYLWVSVT